MNYRSFLAHVVLEDVTFKRIIYNDFLIYITFVNVNNSQTVVHEATKKFWFQLYWLFSFFLEKYIPNLTLDSFSS